ncbi:MAG: PilZ domain-containing protein [Archangium sp.]
MNERRTGPRRLRPLVPEPLTRKRERRGDERRDSPRCDIALDVREPGKKSRPVTGDLSIGGASLVTTAPPLGDAIELMFTIPTFAGPIIASGVIVARRGTAKGTQVSVVFTDLDVEAELAIAQFLDQAVPLVRGVFPLTELAP